MRGIEGGRIRPDRSIRQSRSTPARAGGFSATDLAVRLLDIVGAAFLLLLMLPLFALVALAIRLEGPGGTFFRCRRVGRYGRELDVLKFRKMHADAAGPRLTLLGDGRLTKVGARLARWKIDELPQLWTVLRGQMSLVGPRPEDPLFVATAPEAFRDVLAVRPGITGLSQLAFADESSLLQGDDPYDYYVERLLPQKLQMDRVYAESRSFWLNIKILVWTARMILLGDSVAVDRQTGSLSVRHQRPDAAPLASLEQLEQSQS